MTRADITALRAQACRVMAALGETLDSLTVADEVLASPSEDHVDALVAAQHVGEAATAAETLAALANDFALALDKHDAAIRDAIQKNEEANS